MGCTQTKPIPKTYPSYIEQLLLNYVYIRPPLSKEEGDVLWENWKEKANKIHKKENP